ncbi:MAG: hypothetical protein EXR77_12065 [Myxococcales bacterium]|nr:hypothetical protein [Myxococcales bacterium]
MCALAIVFWAAVLAGCSTAPAAAGAGGLDFGGLSTLEALSGETQATGATEVAIGDAAVGPDTAEIAPVETGPAEIGSGETEIADGAAPDSQANVADAVTPADSAVEVASADAASPTDDAGSPAADGAAEDSDGESLDGGSDDLVAADGADDAVDVTVAADSEVAGQQDASPLETTDVWSPAVGGNPGSGCYGKDGTVTCSADSKYRVECNNGAWTAIQHCGFGVCTASLSVGGAVLTICGVPKAKLLAINAACARYIKCFGGPSHEDCVRANVDPAGFSAGLSVGVARPVIQLAFREIQANVGCSGKATTCTGLAECLYFFGQSKCPTATGCSDDLAWKCAGGGATLAINCKAVGGKCTIASGQASCIKAEPCSPASTVTCAKTVGSMCSKFEDNKLWLVQVDCAAAVGSCVGGATSLASTCSGPIETPCDGKDFIAKCDGKAAQNCQSGDTVSTSCAAGMTCVVENQFNLFESACPEGQGCAAALCADGGPCTAKAKCNGTEVWFCENKQPVAYDCKAVGMTCGLAPSGPRCQ